jgi:spoIIIJ-associated protein
MDTHVISTIKSFLAVLGIEKADISTSTIAGQTIVSVTAPGIDILSRHAEAPNAFEYLIKKIAEKSQSVDETRTPYVIDTDGSRLQYIRDLDARATMMADRARSFQYDVELPPMHAYDRLIVHSALQNSPNIRTESNGEGQTRRVVIKYVG